MKRDWYYKWMSCFPRVSDVVWLWLLLFLFIFLYPTCSEAASWTTGLTHDPAAGTDRFLVFITANEDTTDCDVTNVSFGGQTLTMAVEEVVEVTGRYSRAEIWYLDELGIQAATSNTFVVTTTGVPSEAHHAAATFQGIDQVEPFVDTASNTVDNAATISTSLFSTVQGGVSVVGAAHGAAGSYNDADWGVGWIEGTDQAGASATLGTANTDIPYVASGTDSATATHTVSTNRQVIVAVSLCPVNSSPDIEIDGDISDWNDDDGIEYYTEDTGGEDDWNSPKKLDITCFGFSSNTEDTVYVLYGFDEIAPISPMIAGVFIDTDGDEKMNYALEVIVSVSGIEEVSLYQGDDTLTYGLNNATLVKTYTDPSSVVMCTSGGVFGGTDTYVEVALPYADLGLDSSSVILVMLVSHKSTDVLADPQDSIFGAPGEQDYTHRIKYDLDDGDGEVVGPAGTVPIAFDDEASTLLNIPVSIDVMSNDSLNEPPVSIVSVSDPLNGTAVINDNGTPSDGTDDVVVYTPNNAYAGSDSFQYIICNSAGYTSCADVTITIAAPIISISKSVSTFSDPQNGSTNPKAIPGSLLIYTIEVSNTGNGPADTDSIIITDMIPDDLDISLGDFETDITGPVKFVDGSIPSGLSYTFTSLNSTTDDLAFSNDGGATYDYIPAPDSEGFDLNVTHLKINPKGAFEPSDAIFTIQLKVKVH